MALLGKEEFYLMIIKILNLLWRKSYLFGRN